MICHLKAMRSGYLDTAGEIGMKEGNENEWRVVQGRVQTGRQRWGFFKKIATVGADMLPQVQVKKMTQEVRFD